MQITNILIDRRLASTDQYLSYNKDEKNVYKQ